MEIGGEQPDHFFLAAKDRHLNIRFAARDRLLGLNDTLVAPGVVHDHRLAAAQNVGLDGLAIERDRLGISDVDKFGGLSLGARPKRGADGMQRIVFEQVEYRALEVKVLSNDIRDRLEQLWQREHGLEVVRDLIQRSQLA